MKIDKFEASKRQLREAIYMFFARRDPIATHTVACAASQVLADIARAKGVFHVFRNEEIIFPERRKEWRAAIKSAENFFKHADRDSEASIEFNPLQTEFIIFEAAHVYKELRGKSTFEGHLFMVWFLLKDPSILLDGPLKTYLEKYRGHLRPDDYELCLKILQHHDSFGLDDSVHFE